MSLFVITGGAGFIGSNLAESLLQKGHEVRLFDNLTTGFRENFESFKDDVEFIEGDIRDLEALQKAFKGADYVLHQAALRAVLRSVDDPLESNAVNCTGILNTLIAARDQGVKRFVWSSSSSVYGANPELPKVEEMKPEPISPYAASKILGEYYAKIFYNLYGLETVSLRYFNVFGPRQNPGSKYSAVIPIFIDALSRDEAPEIHGDGEQSRDFSYIDNVVEGNLKACFAEGAPGESFNIACNEQHSVLDMYNGICRILGKDIKPIHTESRPGDVKHTRADISKAEKVLGFEVQTRFEDGLKKTVDWFMNDYFKR